MTTGGIFGGRRQRRGIFGRQTINLGAALDRYKASLELNKARKLADDILDTSIKTEEAIQVRRDVEAGPQRELADRIAGLIDAKADKTDPDWIDKTLNLPGVRHALQGLEVLNNTVFTPIAAGLTFLVQSSLLPGEQAIERKIKTGEGFISPAELTQIWNEEDLPTTGPFPILPFEVRIPGTERTFQEIQLGAKGLAELVAGAPLDVAAVGAGRVLRTGAKRAIAEVAAKRTIGVSVKQIRKFQSLNPGTGEWMDFYKANPADRSDMLEWARRSRQRLPADTPGTITPSVNPDSALGNLVKTLDEADKAAPLIERVGQLGTVRRWLEEKVTDSQTRINAATRRVKNDWRKKFGEDLPEGLNAEMHRTLLAGASSAGTDRAVGIIKNSWKALGTNIDRKFLDAYLILRHQKDILNMHPERKLPAGITRATDLDAALDDMATTLGNQSFSRVEDAARVMRDGYRQALDLDVIDGLVSKELADTLKKTYPWYNPVAYQKTIGEYIEGAGRRPSVSRSGLRRLSETGSEEALVRPTDAIFQSFALRETLRFRNRAANATVDMLQYDPKTIIRKLGPDDTVASGKSTISRMVSSNREIWEVPEWVARADAMLAHSTLSSVEKVARVFQAPFRAGFVTYNPAFMATQGFFDAATVAFTHHILPTRVAVKFAQNLKAIFKEDATLSSMMRAGGDVMNWWGRQPASEATNVLRKGQIAVRTEGDWKRFMAQPWELVRDIGHALEMAPRRAVFEKVLNKGSSAAEAAFQARRATVDFSRAGQAVRFANSFYLFLNPAVQGTLLPIRAVRDLPKARVSLLGIQGVNMSAYMWNRQFEEYKDIPDQDKYGGLIVMLPSHEIDPKTGKTVPHYFKLIPNLREFGALFAPSAYIMEQLDGKDPASFTQVMSAIVPQVVPGVDILENPMPTELGRFFNELVLNKDTFLDRPIVPPEFEGRPTSEQFDVNTSEVAQRVGQWLQVSPFKIDHLLRQGIGFDIITGIDAALRHDQGEDPEIEAIAQYLKSLGELYPADQVRLIRNQTLSDLPVEKRELVIEAEKRRDPSIPFLSSIQRRFYRTYGGQLYWTGLEEAAKEAGLSLEQLSEFNRRLGKLSTELDLSREYNNAAFENGELTGIQWRESRKDIGRMFQGALKALGVNAPSVADLMTDSTARANFYNQVYTIAGRIEDTRTRAEILLAGLRAIPVSTFGETTVEDWDSYFALREEYMNGLSSEDRQALLQLSESRLPPFDREFERQRDRWSVYWEVPDMILKDRPDRLRQYREFVGLSGTQREAVMRRHPWLKTMQSQVRMVREQMRKSSPDLDIFLVRFEYAGKLIHPEFEGRNFELEIAPWLSGKVDIAMGE